MSIEEGETSTFIDCDGNWCLHRAHGPDGYDPQEPPGVRHRRVVDDDVDVNLGFGVNSNGNFSFGFGISDY